MESSPYWVFSPQKLRTTVLQIFHGPGLLLDDTQRQVGNGPQILLKKSSNGFAISISCLSRRRCYRPQTSF